MTNTSADTPVDTGATRDKARTGFENLSKEDVRSLLNEIELLKVNNENMRAKLSEHR